MSDITDAGPRLRAMNEALEENDRLRAEIERLRQFGTLTRGERRALEFAIGVYPLDDSVRDTLRSLLRRLG